MSTRRRFGRVRRLPSGRYQVRYPGPDGTDRPAPQTFATKKAAEVWLTLQESEIKRGDWLDPSAGAVPFGKYAADWLDQHQLSPKTAQLYELLLRPHLTATFGELSIGDIRQEHVRAWRAAGARRTARRSGTLPAIRHMVRQGRVRRIGHLSCGFEVWSG